MNQLPPADFGHRTVSGAAARLQRQELETGALGRARTPAEEVEYLECCAQELHDEFPGLRGEFDAVQQRLAAAREALKASQS